VVTDGYNLNDILESNKSEKKSRLLLFLSHFLSSENLESCDKEMFISFNQDHYIYVETLNGKLDVKFVLTRKFFQSIKDFV
jgi:hypothetical protein